MVSFAYLKLLIFFPAILIPACASSSPAFLMIYSAYKLNNMTIHSLDILLSRFGTSLLFHVEMREEKVSKRNIQLHWTFKLVTKLNFGDPSSSNHQSWIIFSQHILICLNLCMSMFMYVYWYDWYVLTDMFLSFSAHLIMLVRWSINTVYVNIQSNLQNKNLNIEIYQDNFVA